MQKPRKSSDRSWSNGLYERLRGKLGVSRILSERDIVSLIEKRLPSASIRNLLQGGFSSSEIYELIVPRRTLAHRVAKRQALSREESDKAVRVARVAALAEEVFGETDRAWRWLRKPKRQFGGKSSVEMLATEAGARMVEELLAQIDHGLAA